MAKIGGSLCIAKNSIFAAEGNSSVTFNKNEADLGGAVYCTNNSVVLFKTFHYHAINLHGGGTLFYTNTSKSMNTIFINNKAMQGGAIYVTNKSDLQFRESSLVTFMQNNAKYKGGAISCNNNSNMHFEEKSYTSFIDNNSELGGAAYLESKTVITFKGNYLVEFIDNYAEHNGGAVCLIDSKGKF